MQYIDIKTRFYQQYKGDIRDPILTILLDTLDRYQYDLQAQNLIGVYAPWSGQMGDGLFDALRRNLFGQMFPGPAFVTAQASLFEVQTAEPFEMMTHHICSLQDAEGNKNTFSPQRPTWILPAFSNEVSVKVDGEDLLLGFPVVFEHWIDEFPQAELSIFTAGIDPFIIERLKCRILNFGIKNRKKRYVSPFRSPSIYPGASSPAEDFFITPFEYSFVELPIRLLAEYAVLDDAGTYWLRLESMADTANDFGKKLTFNAIQLWNLVRSEMIAQRISETEFSMPETNSLQRHTLITSVTDLGSLPPLEYADTATVLDPGYPYQFSSVSEKNGVLRLALTPAPSGDVKIQYVEYELGNLIENISSGRAFGLYQGMDERVKSLQSITPTHRNEALADKQRVWAYFRSLLASRNRLLSRDDLRTAIVGFPAFARRSSLIDATRISITEKVGRVRGFLTPYTEVTIPVPDESLLKQPEKKYFQQEIASYLKERTLNSNFLGVRFISINEA